MILPWHWYDNSNWLFYSREYFILDKQLENHGSNTDVMSGDDVMLDDDVMSDDCTSVAVDGPASIGTKTELKTCE